MNKLRRKNIQEVIDKLTSLQNDLESLESDVESIQDEEITVIICRKIYRVQSGTNKQIMRVILWKQQRMVYLI